MTGQVVAFNKPLEKLVLEIRGHAHDAGRAETTCAKHQLQAGLRLLEARGRIEAGEAGEVDWWAWYEENFKGYIKSRSYAEKLMRWAKSDDPEGAIEAEKERVRDAVQAHREEASALRNADSSDQSNTDIVEKALRIVARMTADEREQFHISYTERFQ